MGAHMSNNPIPIPEIEQKSFDIIISEYPDYDKMLLTHTFFHAPSNYTIIIFTQRL